MLAKESGWNSEMNYLPEKKEKKMNEKEIQSKIYN